MAVSAPVFVRQFLAVLDAFLPVSMICLISLITCEKFYTFAPQSRAFLSQLSVTGDESGFFYVLPPRPALEIMPMALVFCIHSFALNR